MTQEKKLEEAKRLYQTANADQRYVLESLFPELAESEDERMRKAIINTIEDCSPILSPEVQKRMIAWIEKQIPKPKWSENDEHHWMMCLECVEECATQEREDFSKTIDWLKSIKKAMEEQQ